MGWIRGLGSGGKLPESHPIPPPIPPRFRPIPPDSAPNPSMKAMAGALFYNRNRQFLHMREPIPPATEPPFILLKREKHKIREHHRPCSSPTRF